MSEELLLALALAGAAIFLLWRALIMLDRARHIEDIPTSRIRSAAQGYVELEGIARPDQPSLRAPLTGEPCLWYSFRVERYSRSGKSHVWRLVRSGRSDTSFYLDDETGRCHIHPEGADVRPRSRQVWYGHTDRPMGPAGGSGSGVLFSSGRYRYTEERIHAEDYLYALGLFQSLAPASPDEQTADRMLHLLKTWKSDHQKLLARFDADGDGEISQAEWESARQEAAREAQTYVLQNYDAEVVHMLARPPGRRQHFILAARDPRRLIRSYRWSGWGMALAALAMVGIASWLLINSQVMPAS